MKAPLRRFFAALFCLATLSGCTTGREIPKGCLTTITEAAQNGRNAAVIPVWLDPDGGTITPVCDEETHGADCPFLGLDDSVRSYLTTEDGTIYYFTEQNTDTGDKTATLWEYTIRNGKTREIDSRTDTLWRSKTLLTDGYVFQWERDEKEERCDLTCMALSDRTHEKHPISAIPQKIVETGSGAYAYYLLDDANGYPCGFYRADWRPSAAQGQTARTLLFYDGKCRITGIWCEDDVVYWRGQLRYDAESDTQYLYRYDPKTDETTEVCELYGGTQMVGHGDFFYYIQHVTYPDGDRESRYVFSRLRKSTGESKVLDTLPVEWKSDGAPRIYESWVLVRLLKVADNTEGFYCWNIDTGEAKLISAADAAPIAAQ